MIHVEPPPGYHSVTSRMVVSDVAGVDQFPQTVFDATDGLQQGLPTECGSASRSP